MQTHGEQKVYQNPADLTTLVFLIIDAAMGSVSITIKKGSKEFVSLTIGPLTAKRNFRDFRIIVQNILDEADYLS